MTVHAAGKQFACAMNNGGGAILMQAKWIKIDLARSHPVIERDLRKHYHVSIILKINIGLSGNQLIIYTIVLI